MMMKCQLTGVDAYLTKAIKGVVALSIAVHLVLLVKNSSKWLNTISIAKYMDDFPTHFNESISWSNDHKSNCDHALDMYSQLSLSSSSTDVRAPHTTNQIPLEELVQSNTNVVCIPGKSLKRIIQDTILPENLTHTRKIPKIVHVTSKTRCMTPPFLDNLDKWRLPGHSFYFHDEVAVDRFMAKFWPEFPQLQLLQKCTVSGAAKADLWRLLVLWEYGGIYTGTLLKG